MAFTKEYKDVVFDASADKKILVSVDKPYYGIQVNYKDFDPGAGTLFKLHRYIGNNPNEDELTELEGSETIIDDTDGVRVFKNGTPESAYFLVLEFVADTNTGTYTVNTNFRN